MRSVILRKDPAQTHDNPINTKILTNRKILISLKNKL